MVAVETDFSRSVWIRGVPPRNSGNDNAGQLDERKLPLDREKHDVHRFLDYAWCLLHPNVYKGEVIQVLMLVEWVFVFAVVVHLD